MKVLGVDPGYGRTGVAVLSGTGRDNVEHLHLIETPAKMPHEQRLKMVHDELTQVAVDFGAEIMAIERLFHGKNAKTVIGVAEARGVALLVAAQQGLPVAE